MSDFKCPKCGAELNVEQGTQMATCSFCGTVTYIDRSSAVFFYLLPFSIEKDNAQGIFKRWKVNPGLPKDMDANAEITEIKKEFFPVFVFRRSIDGKENVSVKPAKGTLLPGMQNLTVPPGNLQIFSSKVSAGDAQVIQPDITMDSYIPELTGDAIDQSIVYFPIYEITYKYKGDSYQLVLDGSSGDIHSANAPKRSSTTYILVVGLAFILGLFGGLLLLSGGFLLALIGIILIVAAFFAGKLLGNKVVSRENIKPSKQTKEKPKPNSNDAHKIAEESAEPKAEQSSQQPAQEALPKTEAEQGGEQK